MMLQWSVYSRVCRGDDAAEKHGQRVTKNLPPRGSVRTLQIVLQKGIEGLRRA
jgi:CRISPR-associated protein Cas2